MERERLTSQLKYVRLFPDNATIVRGKRSYVSTAISEMQAAVDRRHLLEWTYFAELSYLPLERQEIAVTAATALYIIASQDGGSLRILPLIH